MGRQHRGITLLIAGLAGCHGVPRAPAPSAPAEPPPVATVVVPPAAPLPSASAAPDPEPPPPRIEEIALAVDRSCARTSAQEVYCWGDDQYGQLGDGATGERLRPVRLAVKGAVQLGLGNYYGCARLAGGSVVCWGSRKKGSIGDGRPKEGFTTPVEVPGIEGAQSVFVGKTMACAMGGDARVRCWGQRWTFLGDFLLLPTEVPELRGAARLAMSFGHHCVQQAEGGAVRCAGEPRSLDMVGGLRTEVVDVRAFSPNGWGMCAVTGGGALVCWGTVEDDGYSPSLQWARPTVMPAPVPFKQVAVGGSHVCAVDAEGAVWCFGRNGEGQLGDGTRTPRLALARVAGVDGVVNIAAGEAHTCALTREATLWCWGRNKNGQLGDGTRERRLRPVAIPW